MEEVMFFDRYCWSGVFMNGALADLECCVLISYHQISVTMINLIKSSGLSHPSDLRLKMMDQEEGREDNAINWKPLFLICSILSFDRNSSAVALSIWMIKFGINFKGT